MDWVHCNNCFFLPDNVKKFFLTSCGHIYCNDCEEHYALGKCKLCGNHCSTIAISSTMKSDVQVYFSDPTDLLKIHVKEVYQVSDFQKNHRARLMAHQRKQLKKMKTVKEDFRKLIKNLKDLNNERKKLSQENLSLKKHLTDQRSDNSMISPDRGHPRQHYNSPPCSDMNDFILKFGKREGWRSNDSSCRLSVLSPPKNGKLGFIPDTPSPSISLDQLDLSSCSKESNNRSHGNRSRSTFLSLNRSGGSVTEGLFTPPNNPPNKKAQYKKDVKKVVVHPYSPDDSPIGKDNRSSI